MTPTNTTALTFDFTYFRGRVAMAAALKALGVGAGCDVILQAYTCIAVPEAILAVGAKPVYVDVVAGGVTMDPSSLAAGITEATRAIIVQHTFGVPANMAAIMEIAAARELPIIEDCAHTYWSQVDGQRCGTFGVAASYSLEWGKPLVLGVGGGLMVNDERIRGRLAAHYATLQAPSARRDIRMQLQYAAFQTTYSPRRYWQIKALYGRLSRAGVAEQSFNAMQGEIADDFGLKLSASVARRMRWKMPLFRPDWQRQDQVLTAYRRAVSGAHGVTEIAVPASARPMYGRWPIWVDDKAALLRAAQETGFEVSDWFDTAVDPLDAASFHTVGYEAGACPNAEAAAAHVVSLPMNRRVVASTAERAVSKLAMKAMPVRRHHAPAREPVA